MTTGIKAWLKRKPEQRTELFQAIEFARQVVSSRVSTFEHLFDFKAAREVVHFAVGCDPVVVKACDVPLDGK